MRFGLNLQNQLPMKTLRIMLIGLILLSSCNRPIYYHLLVNDIPTQYPNFNTEIKFKGDGIPGKPYFEIIDIDIYEKGRLNKKQIKKRLQLEAIKEGVDAIIEVDLLAESIQEPNLFTMLLDVMDDDLETTTVNANYTHIRGRGIMYLENLDFIKDQPEFEYFYKIDNNTGFPNPCFKVEYKLTGQVHMVYPELTGDLNIYKEYFQYYSDHHLLKQREGWSYIMDGLLLRKRILRMEDGLISKICIPKYDEKERLIQIKIVHRNSKIDSNEFIYYSYDDNHGKISNRVIEVYNGTKVYEEYRYENDRLTGKKIFINKGHERISLNSAVRYYDTNFLKDYYFNEVVKQKDSSE